MTKPILMALAGYFTLIAAALIVAPLTFYQSIPGVSETGPFNSHFTRDVGFAFLVCAAGLFLGAWRRDRVLALFGAAFPVLHAIFHVASWGHHAFPTHGVATFDLAVTVGPAAAGLFLALRIHRGAA
ncbi:hypothetical protein A8B82_08450 [Sulfitobacter sp. EhC04]|nr:hypothetical protein A8B82_08450 [Sulfitobacter sp. EhC04]